MMYTYNDFILSALKWGLHLHKRICDGETTTWLTDDFITTAVTVCIEKISLFPYSWFKANEDKLVLAMG